MSETKVEVYKHSGRWSPIGVLASLAIVTAIALPGSFIYSYCVFYFPFDILCFIATGAYGFICGFITVRYVKKWKVRNNAIAALVGLLAGSMALYLAWSAYAHVMYEDSAWFYFPWEVWELMEYLYEHGSWGYDDGEPITGIMLAIIWLLEAGVIIGLSCVTVVADVADTPFCEKEMVWLEDDKTIETLALFSDEEFALLADGDLRPLLQARPKHIHDPAWTRIVLKYSSQSNETYTMKIIAVHLQQNKEGELEETSTDITPDLLIDKSGFEVVKQFADLQPLTDDIVEQTVE